MQNGCSSLAGIRVLLALTAALLAFVVQSGELGSADTMHRLQTAHSFWTPEPAVFPNEYPEFGVHGRGGKLYDWYGIGQPLLLLPVDIIATYLERSSLFDSYGTADPSVRNIFVSYTTNIFLNVLTALVAFRFLLLLAFSVREAAAGVLTLLILTSHLHYTQNMMENNYIELLTLAGFCLQYEWLKTGSRRALVLGSGALGLNLLTRLTTLLDLTAAGLFLALVLWFERAGWREIGRRFRTYAKIAVPVYLFFLFLDRLYQFYRFGTWMDTYVHYFTLEHRLHDPTLPRNYPWETPFHVGFLGPLVSPEKSIFLFDPLLVATILLAVFLVRAPAKSVDSRGQLDRGALPAPVSAYLLAALILVVGYICFYARYTVWSGDFAWGDRYVSTAVQLAAFISVPILLKFRAAMGRTVARACVALVAASLVVQLASIAFWMPLEIYQMDDLGHGKLVVWLRLKNIAAFALGKMHAWGLATDSMTYDRWDYEHITTWNFLPFLLRRVASAPRWVIDFSFALWMTTLAGLAYALLRLRNAVKNEPSQSGFHSELDGSLQRGRAPGRQATLR